MKEASVADLSGTVEWCNYIEERWDEFQNSEVNYVLNKGEFVYFSLGELYRRGIIGHTVMPAMKRMLAS